VPAAAASVSTTDSRINAEVSIQKEPATLPNPSGLKGPGSDR
jgi:hypothetical protein